MNKEEPKYLWPDGTPKHANVCKSELQLLSEIHFMLTNMTIRNQLIDLNEGSPLLDRKSGKTPEIPIEGMAAAFIFDPEIAKEIMKKIQRRQKSED